MNHAFANLFGDTIEEVLQANGINAQVTGGQIRNGNTAIAFLTRAVDDKTMVSFLGEIQTTMMRQTHASGFSVMYAEVDHKKAYMLQLPAAERQTEQFQKKQTISFDELRMLRNEAVQNFLAGRPYDHQEYDRALREAGLR